MLYEIYFEGRKPSKNQVKKEITKAVREGYPLIEISWGENMLNFENNLEVLRGWGWIKDIGGDDLAREFNSNCGRF
jgi:hypothetical protein